MSGTLAQHLVHNYGGSGGSVERIDFAYHGDIYDKVAVIADKSADTVTLRADDKSHRTGEIGLPQVV